MESKIDGTMERIEKLEDFVQQTKENNTKVDQLIKEQVETSVREMKPNMEQSSRNNVNKMMLTAVIGNLDGLGSLAAAQVWLKENFFRIEWLQDHEHLRERHISRNDRSRSRSTLHATLGSLFQTQEQKKQT